jgi:hypothetical protein
MNIHSYNPGHDGAIAYLKDAPLVFSIEAGKNSNYRYSPIYSHVVFHALGELDEITDVICTSGWWPRDHYEYLHESNIHVGYRGLSKSDIIENNSGEGFLLCCEGELINQADEGKGLVDQASLRWLGHE